MKAFVRFNQGILKMPFHWKVWLMCLMAANAVIPMFFIQYLEAQIVLATFMASAGIMTVLTGRFGFSRILGLGHVLWIPLLIFIATRLDDWPSDTSLGQWMRCLAVVNLLSLMIDVTDIIRYLRGDREETVTLP
ncbi:MAG: hypothetical protein HQ518_15945 [Rhodopirellula sp.]|nr:hypothetical protein [Rhodopirellula sp.]